MPLLVSEERHYITISLDEFFEKVTSEPPIKKEEIKEAFKEYIIKHGFKIADSHRFTETIYLDLSEVQQKDPHLYYLVLKDKALALRAFHEALRELGVNVRGFSIGFRDSSGG